LTACGVERSKLFELAEDAAQQWTGTFNPRKVDVESLRALYARALDG
jgi:alcohol dehydrogenase